MGTGRCSRNIGILATCPVPQGRLFSICIGLGSGVVFGNATISGGRKTCAATNSIAVQATVVVEVGGVLEPISPRIEFATEFSVPSGGQLRTISADPSVPEP